MDTGALMVGLLVAVLLGAAVGVDAEKRWGSPFGLVWGLFVGLLAIVGLPCYLIAVAASGGSKPGMARVCPKCGLTTGKDARFCGGCGQSFS